MPRTKSVGPNNKKFFIVAQIIHVLTENNMLEAKHALRNKILPRPRFCRLPKQARRLNGIFRQNGVSEKLLPTTACIEISGGGGIYFKLIRGL